MSHNENSEQLISTWADDEGPTFPRTQMVVTPNPPVFTMVKAGRTVPISGFSPLRSQEILTKTPVCAVTVIVFFRTILLFCPHPSSPR